MTQYTSGLSKSEQMYEKYLQRKDDFVPVKCWECKKTVCYTYGDIDGMLEWGDTTLLCEKCKALLP